MTAESTLAAVLRTAIAAKQIPPCASNPDLWFSDRAAEREAAAWRCRSCPVIDACAAYADALQPPPRHGVWASVDRTVSQRGRTAPPLPTAATA